MTTPSRSAMVNSSPRAARIETCTSRARALWCRAVPVRAVKSDMAGLRCVRDQRPLGSLHVRKTSLHRAQAACCKRVIAAGVEDDDFQASPRILHLPQHKRHVEHLEIDIGFTDGIGFHRHQTVGAVDLHARRAEQNRAGPTSALKLASLRPKTAAGQR